MRRWLVRIAVALGIAVAGHAQQVPPGAPTTPYVAPDRAYLFAHLTKQRYGVLHYSVRLDGLRWQALHSGRPASSDCHGHALIVPGGDGRYHPVGDRQQQRVHGFYHDV